MLVIHLLSDCEVVITFLSELSCGAKFCLESAKFGNWNLQERGVNGGIGFKMVAGGGGLTLKIRNSLHFL